jgi:hypothetical protein
MLRFLWSATAKANLGLGSADDFEIMINAAKTGSSKIFRKRYDALYVNNYQYLESKLLKRKPSLTKEQAQNAVEYAFIAFKEACHANYPPVFGHLTEALLQDAMSVT